MTLAEFRKSRFLSQNELADLLGVDRDWVRYRDTRKLTKYWHDVIEDSLRVGPHDFIKPRYFHPDSLKHMSAAVRRRLPLGSCYLSLEYFAPGTLEIAQSRKDLLAIAKKHPAERLFILRRVFARHVAGVQVIGVKVPVWTSPTFDI